MFLATDEEQAEPGNFTLVVRVAQDVQVVHVQSDAEREAVRKTVLATVASLR